MDSLYLAELVCGVLVYSGVYIYIYICECLLNAFQGLTSQLLLAFHLMRLNSLAIGYYIF